MHQDQIYLHWIPNIYLLTTLLYRTGQQPICPFWSQHSILQWCLHNTVSVYITVLLKKSSMLCSAVTYLNICCSVSCPLFLEMGQITLMAQILGIISLISDFLSDHALLFPELELKCCIFSLMSCCPQFLTTLHEPNSNPDLFSCWQFCFPLSLNWSILYFSIIGLLSKWLT